MHNILAVVSAIVTVLLAWALRDEVKRRKKDHEVAGCLIGEMLTAMTEEQKHGVMVVMKAKYGMNVTWRNDAENN